MNFRLMPIAFAFSSLVSNAVLADCDSGNDWITTDMSTATASVTVTNDLALTGSDGSTWSETTVINVDAEHQRILTINLAQADVDNGWSLSTFSVRHAEQNGDNWKSFTQDPDAGSDILADFRYNGINNSFSSEDMTLGNVSSAVIYDRNCHEKDVAFQVCATNSSSHDVVCSDPIVSDKGGSGEQ